MGRVAEWAWEIQDEMEELSWSMHLIELETQARAQEREVERLRVAERAAFDAGCVAMREAAAKRLDAFRVSPAAASLFADVVRAMAAPSGLFSVVLFFV